MTGLFSTLAETAPGAPISSGEGGLAVLIPALAVLLLMFVGVMCLAVRGKSINRQISDEAVYGGGKVVPPVETCDVRTWEQPHSVAVDGREQRRMLLALIPGLAVAAAIAGAFPSTATWFVFDPQPGDAVFAFLIFVFVCAAPWMIVAQVHASRRRARVTIDPLARTIVQDPVRPQYRHLHHRWSFGELVSAQVVSFGERTAFFGAHLGSAEAVEINLRDGSVRVLVPGGQGVPFAESLIVIAGGDPEAARRRAILGDAASPGAELPQTTPTPAVSDYHVSTWTQAHVLGVDRDQRSRGKRGLVTWLLAGAWMAVIIDLLDQRSRTGWATVVTIDPLAREIRWQLEREFGIQEPSARPLSDLRGAEVIQSRVDWGGFDRIVFDLEDRQLSACVPRGKGKVFIESLMQLAGESSATENALQLDSDAAALGRPANRTQNDT